uniref:EGF-like domain-containing protein n=1 Tax=Globodera pallida TaxID=36090 RepID=A0A183C3F6_GLOPA
MKNDCVDSPCALGAKCHDLNNDFECECPHGFSGKRCQIKDDLCDPTPCLNGGQCVDSLFDRHCVCRPGWNGTFCEQEQNECEPNPCKNGASCRDLENAYECECAPGYEGYQCQYMVDHCAVAPCRNNGTCVNRGPVYECQCRLGFDGVHCEHNVDECETMSPCDGTGTERCEDSVNGYRCHCRPGYEGTLCERHVNHCELTPCANNGTCVDMGAGFQCDCVPGWKGQRCELMESQCEERKPCQNNGRCVPLVDDYFCVCPEGVSGKNCELAPNRCLGEPCRNGGVCGDFGSHSECACPRGFDGPGCQYRLDACRSGICRNGGTCVEVEDQSTLSEGSPSGFKCICPPGFSGSECETDIDECRPSPCPLAAQCVDLVNSFHCKCPFNMTGANCEKRIDPDFDLHFLESAHQSSRAGLAIPLRVNSASLSVSIWVRFEHEIGRGGAGRQLQQQQQGAPVFFSLFNSGHPNEPWNLTELLRISSDAVHVHLFPDKELPPLVLYFPAHQRPDTGHVWNNLIFTWSSHQGAYSLVWNAIRLYADEGYGKGKQLDINAWINLGDQLLDDVLPIPDRISPISVITPANAAKFSGWITRVNMWTRVLDFELDIPAIVQRCQGSPVIFDGLALRFANYDRIEGKVERVGKSTCGRAELQCRSLSISTQCPAGENGRRETPEGGENGQPPMVEVEGCPGDIFVETREKETNISWQEPNFFSTRLSMEIVRVEQNLKPGQVFTLGHFSALYVAYDNRSIPLALCRFSIHVVRQFCAEPEAPVNGLQQCEHWGPALRFRACSIQCHAGHAFSVRPAVFYSCADDGEWRPNEAGQRPFRYPQCSRTLPAEHLARVHLNYPQLSLCNPSGKSTLVDQLLQRIGQLDAKWHICERNGDNGDCLGLKCKSSARTDSCRCRSVPIRNANVPDPLGTSQQLREPTDVIREEALQHRLFSLEQVLPNGRPDLGAFWVEDAFRCPSGYVLLNDSCVPCAPGTFFFIPTGQCQPDAGSTECIPCGIGKTTLDKNSSNEEQCRDECPDGEQLTAGGSCQSCPLGTYRTKGRQKQCVECPAGTTTEDVGATTSEACNTPKCQPGQFLVVSEKRCELCPRGTFQEQPLQKQCKKCPSAYNTAKEGATLESQCYSTDQCALGQDNCSWNAQCFDLPDQDDLPSWRCVCNPGFRGNGVNCTDACLNFCLNDGICRKNRLGHVECQCKENFSGERCEIRFQPRSQKLAYWTGTIVSVVFLLIIVVVVIWMISLRFSRSSSSEAKFMSSLEKPSVFSAVQPDSPLASNFLYGRAPPRLPIDRSHSSSLAGSIRPLGFYYEDEQPYEQSGGGGTLPSGAGRHLRGGSQSQEAKSLFLGGPDGSDSSTVQLNNALGPGSRSPVGAGSESDQQSPGGVGSFSATRELEQRLRHVQQHMYRPITE